MNENYAEAERLTFRASVQSNTADAMELLAAAQVHATLALVDALNAARFVSPQQQWGGHDIGLANPEEWR